MKAPLIFKGDTRFVYASGVVRGLENYLLTRADYQKVMDAAPEQLGTVLGEIGYGGGEHNPEHALDLATEQLLSIVDKLSGNSRIGRTLRLSYDFRNAAAYLKYLWFSGEGEFKSFLPWGTLEPDALRSKIEDILNEQSADIEPTLAGAVEQARHLKDAYKTPLAVDIAFDRAYYRYAARNLPEGEYFSRWMAVMSDWANLKSFVRVINFGLNRKLFWETFAEGGDIPAGKFREAADLDAESIPAVFVHTEYGSRLSDVIKTALGGEMSGLDLFFRAKLMELYRYTRYCIFGPELLWAYAMTKQEEINTLRVILRAKGAKLPFEMIREVISVVLE